MTRVSKEDPPPPGFERLWLDCGTALLVPSAVAELRTQDGLRRSEQEEDRQREELGERESQRLAQALREKLARAAPSRPQRKAVDSCPPAGWYRVLPRLEELAQELERPEAADRSADSEVNERRKRIIARLLELGPDRRVALPKEWRRSVDELEETLPHFRGPIRSIRHALALADATGTPPRIAPQLLLGPPGVGKTYFSHRLAEMFGSRHVSVQFDQPSAGSQLRGSDKYWANTEPGLLFNMICLGEIANPIVLLDEMDKAVDGASSHPMDPLTQLHGALEPETARCLMDTSVDVEFDASLAAYIGTANSPRGLSAPILTRMEVFAIEPPRSWEAIDIAGAIAQGLLRRLGLEGQLEFERRAVYLLAHLSPRLMTRTAEKAVAAAVASGRRRIGESEIWNELGGLSELKLH
jgi:ATP-dependent Lon protease